MEKTQTLYSKDSTDYDTGGHLTARITMGQVEVRLQSTSDSHFVNSGPIAANTWYHVAFSWGSNGMQLYLDSELVGTNEYTGGLTGNLEPLVIGANQWSSGDQVVDNLRDFFDGNIAEVAIFDTQFTQSQIVDLFNAGVNGTDTSDAEGDALSNIENLIGSDHADILSGDAGANILNGGAGADTLNGDAGDDILVWDSADATIDGGSGSDTLRTDGGDVDLTTFAGTISGIEVIDLEADAGANALTLTALDVLDLSDTDTLTVLGDAGDSVNASAGWTDGGFDDSGNHVYTQMVGPSLATLLVDPDVSVNPDILA